MMKIDEIKAVMKLMNEFKVSEFKIEEDGCQLSIVRNNGAENAAAPTAVFAIPAAAPAQVPAPAPVPAAPAPAEAKPDTPPPARKMIEAPLVGTFYRSASPDSKVFVSVGDKVNENTVVCIIEAMKVMNEIKAEKTGIIREVLVENGQPVEYGQPLFILE